MTLVQWLLLAGILLICVLLILVILVQRGRGEGLAGAFGGGGSSAFGAKTGDVFTGITVAFASIFFLLNVVGNYAFKVETTGPTAALPTRPAPAPAPSTPSPTPITPVPGTPVPVTPAAIPTTPSPTPVTPSAEPVLPPGEAAAIPPQTEPGADAAGGAEEPSRDTAPAPSEDDGDDS